MHASTPELIPKTNRPEVSERMKDEENPCMLRISLKDLAGTSSSSTSLAGLSSFQIKISDIYWLYTLIKCCGIQTQNAAMIDHDGTITVKKNK